MYRRDEVKNDRVWVGHLGKCITFFNKIHVARILTFLSFYSITRFVGRSVGQSVCWSVGHRLRFRRFWAPLPKCLRKPFTSLPLISIHPHATLVAVYPALFTCLPNLNQWKIHDFLPTRGQMVKHVTRGHNIVADGSAGASIPQSHPMPPPYTRIWIRKPSKLLIFPLFDLCPWTNGPKNRRDGPTDHRTDEWTDEASYRCACTQLKRQNIFVVVAVTMSFYGQLI